MTRMGSAALALCTALCVVAGPALAQGTPRGGGGPGGGRMYDTKTVETVTGDVVRVERVAGRGQGRGRGGQGGVHLVLKTASEELSVHVGPSWYLDQQPMKIAAGDHLEVRGSRITYEGKPALIAARIKKGDQSLTLRDDAGLPVWRGQGRRGR